MNHIFISYSRKDEAIVDCIVDSLRANNINIWQDKSGPGSGIPFSTKWFDVIVEALYNSRGAIIFYSEAWECSIPCAKEKEIITKCGIPVIYLRVDDCESSHEAAVEKVLSFIESDVEIEHNHIRTDLFSNSFSYKCGVDPYQLVSYSRSFNIIKTIGYLRGPLKQMSTLLKVGDYEEKNPEFLPFMVDYIRFAKRTTIKNFSVLLFGLLFSISMTICIITALIVVPKSMDKQELAFDGMAQASVIDQAVSSDPLAAIESVVNFSKQRVYTESFYTLNNSANRINCVVLPKRVLVNASENELSKYRNREKKQSDNYSIEVSDTLGTITIDEKATGLVDTLNTPAAIKGFNWNKKCETEIVYWTNRRVFIYDVNKKGAPIELNENYQTIKEVVCYDSSGEREIVALTEDGTLIVWDNPLSKKTIKRTGIEYAEFIEKEDAITAIYIDDNNIISNTNNKETIIHTTTEGNIVAENFSLSHDNNYIAYIYKSDNYRVIVISLSDGEIIHDIELPYQATSVVFSPDDSHIYASSNGGGLMAINIKEESVICSGDNYYLSNLTCFGDTIITSDYHGYFLLYNNNLKKEKDAGIGCNYSVPLKKMKAAKDKGYVFMSNRGGGETTGCSRYDINRNKNDLFFVGKKDGVASNTSVAVSFNEEYVAFGYPDGSISLYETESMYMADNYIGIGESVNEMHFSQDGSCIYAIGDSGTIYILPINEKRINNDLDDVRNSWEMIQRRLINKAESYYDGIQQ